MGDQKEKEEGEGLSLETSSGGEMVGESNHEMAYLQRTVGEALARGCAETAVARPADPVEFLGQWLLR